MLLFWNKIITNQPLNLIIVFFISSQPRYLYSVSTKSKRKWLLEEEFGGQIFLELEHAGVISLPSFKEQERSSVRLQEINWVLENILQRRGLLGRRVFGRSHHAVREIRAEKELGNPVRDLSDVEKARMWVFSVIQFENVEIASGL